jgi:hypothetical protein
MEIFNKVEKKRRRSASVDLSQDPQRKFDCYPQPPKTSAALYSCARFARVKFWRGTPITLRAGRRVGDILKCIPENGTVQPSFRFFI